MTWLRREPKGNSFAAAAAYARMVLKEIGSKMTTQERMLLTALEEKDHWRSRALKAEGLIENELELRRLMEKSSLDEKRDVSKPGVCDSPGCTLCHPKEGEAQKSSLDEDPPPDCHCHGFVNLSLPGQIPYGYQLISYSRGQMQFMAKKGCPDCGGTGYRRKADPYEETIQKACDLAREEERRKNEGSAHMADNVAAQPPLVEHCCPECLNLQVPVREGNLDVYRCVNPTCSKSPKKPIRLLVEVVPQKDEKHGIGRQEFHDGICIAAFSVQPNLSSPAMSVQELPQMPSLKELTEIYWMNGQGIKAVLKAVGLEVGE